MKAAIGIDTSNYTTSAAAVSETGKVIADVRRLLNVKNGERGLRQSDALFQHITNMPEIIEQLMSDIRSAGEKSGESFTICAAGASTKPRPAAGSYMPVFLSGEGTARSIAAALEIPFFAFSHQEGHIAAVCGADDDSREFLSFHLSGGTGEIIRVRGCMPEEIIGGVRDISFGQVLDRAGVAAGLSFPAGAQLDRIACENRNRVRVHFSSRGRMIADEAVLGPVHTEGAWANLSGIETQAIRAIESGTPIEHVAPELFYHISEALVRMVSAAADASGIRKIVFAGGVSASAFIRSELEKRLPVSGTDVSFGPPGMSSDNACGTAALAMKEYLNS